MRCPCCVYVFTKSEIYSFVGRQSRTGSRVRWSKKELELVESNLHLTVKELCDMLPRKNYSAVASKVKSLKKSPPEILKCPECGKEFSKSEVFSAFAAFGGKVKTAKKAVSSRVNGRLGGRGKKNKEGKIRKMLKENKIKFNIPDLNR